MGRVVTDLDVEHRGQAAQALRADAEGIDPGIKFDAQFFQLGFRPAREQFVHVERLHQYFLRHHHGFLRGAAHTDADQSGRAPARAHDGYGLQHPVHHRIGGIEHGELRFGFRTAALGRDRDLELIAGHQFHVHHGRRVVLGVLAREQRIGQHRAAQRVIRMGIGAAHALIDRIGDRALEAVPAHVHADLEVHIDDAGVLADRAVALGAHARVGQYLRNRILGRGRLLAFIGAAEVGEVVLRMIIADELQGIGDAPDQIFLLDGCHVGLTGVKWH